MAAPGGAPILVKKEPGAPILVKKESGVPILVKQEPHAPPSQSQIPALSVPGRGVPGLLPFNKGPGPVSGPSSGSAANTSSLKQLVIPKFEPQPSPHGSASGGGETPSAWRSDTPGEWWLALGYERERKREGFRGMSAGRERERESRSPRAVGQKGEADRWWAEGGVDTVI